MTRHRDMLPIKIDCCSTRNMRIPTVCAACAGLCASGCTAIVTLIAFGERRLIVDRPGNEQVLSLLCVLYTVVLMVKCGADLLLACGAYKV